VILVFGRNPVGNVIHAVLGPESNAWEDLHGSLTVDITPLLKLCDGDAPVLLNISSCKNESQTAHNLQALITNGADYPFLPNTMVMAPQLATQQNEQKHTSPDTDNSAGERHKEESNQVTTKIGKCSRCSSESSELVPGMDPAICFSCAKIDLYHARKDKPLGRHGEDDTIRDAK
jgi:hypothetical protein